MKTNIPNANGVVEQIASAPAELASGGTARDVREVIYLDPAYSLATVRRRDQLQFVRSRNRGGYFTFVWSVHPFVGVAGNRWAGAIREVRFDRDHLVFDGFQEGVRIPRWLIPLNVLWAELRLTWKLARLARSNRVKAIFAADTSGCALIGLILSKISGKPLLVAVYANQDENWEANRRLASPRLLPSRKLEKWVLNLALRAAVMIEVGTQNMRDYAVRNGADPARIAVLPVVKFIGDVHFNEPRDRPDPGPFLRSHGVPPAPVYLLYVGRLADFKHTADVIPAMEIVIRHSPEVIGLLAGSGELADSLRSEIASRCLERQIFLLGDCDHATLAALAPHCVTLSPLTGMALIETSLAGSPPVVYDRDWQPEFVTDGYDGFVVPFRDAVALGQKALQLVSDAALRRKLGENARRKALKFADPQDNATKERTALAGALGAEHDESLQL